jgi:hypothetical protein
MVRLFARPIVRSFVRSFVQIIFSCRYAIEILIVRSFDHSIVHRSFIVPIHRSLFVHSPYSSFFQIIFVLPSCCRNFDRSFVQSFDRSSFVHSSYSSFVRSFIVPIHRSFIITIHRSFILSQTIHSSLFSPIVNFIVPHHIHPATRFLSTHTQHPQPRQTPHPLSYSALPATHIVSLRLQSTLLVSTSAPPLIVSQHHLTQILLKTLPIHISLF